MSKETKSRPKAGSYPTFTVAARNESRLAFQKARYYAEDKRGSRVMVDERVPVTIQRGVEFDVYRECLGDGKTPANPFFHKLVTKGYVSDGKTVLLDPDELQKFLEGELGKDSNRIIPWSDRPRPEAEKAMERALAAKDAQLTSKETQLESLRKALKGRGMKDEEIEALITKAG